MPDLKETNVISLLMEVKWRNGPTAIERHAESAKNGIPPRNFDSF